MRRRELLQSIAATTLLTGGKATGEDEDEDVLSGRGASSRDASVEGGTRRHPGQAERRLRASGDAVSVRAVGERMDPVRPPTALRGNGTPFSRTETPPRDTSHLPAAVDTSTATGSAYDFGMAHRQDKGIVESHRYALADHARSTGSETSLSLRSAVGRHRVGYEYDVLFCNYGYHDEYEDSDPERLRALGRAIEREGYDLAFVSGLPEIENDGLFDGDEADRRAAEILEDSAGTVRRRIGIDTSSRSDLDGDEFPVVLYLDNDSRRGPRAKTQTIPERLVDELDLPPYLEGRPYHDWFCPSQAGRMEKGKTGLTGFISDNHKECGLFNRITLGHGDVSVYFARLQSGAGEKYTHARQHQLSDILNLIGNKHPATPDGEVTILVGAFDLPPAEYDDLYREVPGYRPHTAILDDHGFQDAWLTHGGREGATDLGEGRPAGGGSYCRGAGSDGRCDPYPGQHHNDRRRDFVFIERPETTHAIHLDVHRLRRRLLSVAGSGSDSATEHLGVELSVTVSPRPDPVTSGPPDRLELSYSLPTAGPRLASNRADVSLVIGYDLELRNSTGETMNGITVSSELRSLDIITSPTADYLEDPDPSDRSMTVTATERVDTIAPNASKTVHPEVLVPGTWVADLPSTAPQEGVPTEFLDRVGEAAGSIREAVIEDTVASEYAGGTKTAVVEVEHDTSPGGTVEIRRR